ncbi:MAG: chorismate mutase [bacterium]
MKKDRLDILGQKIASVDRHFVHLLARRVRLAKEVAMIKIEDGSPLYRSQKEKERLDQVSKWAEEEGVNPEFARSLLYPVIGESCKNQMVIVDSLRLGNSSEKFNPTYEELQANLIRLTESWAPKYDLEYDREHPATAALTKFEHGVIDRIISQSCDGKYALDLGCATGKEIRRLSKRFRKLQGFDISPAMVEFGLKGVAKEGLKNINLEVHDIESRFPVEDCSVSFLIMNNGTGSDVQNLSFVFSEIRRVLKPHGRFLISFYNKEAWAQRTFFPWPLGLVAGIDQERNCLEVRLGNELIPIFAQPYTLSEIKGMIPDRLCVLESYTYPVLTSILPTEIIESIKPVGTIQELDDIIVQTETGLGAYIIVAGKKV